MPDNLDTFPNFNVEQEAQRELAKRELARRRFLPFVQRFNPDYQAGWVHKDICNRLEQFSQDVVDRKSPRLMIFMPPRHGKSQLTSKTFPAWHLGHNPRHEFIACSYSGALSMSFSRNVRMIMRDQAYQSLFPTRLDPDSQSVEAWMTTVGGGLVAAGVGGAITGKGAHIMLIDDPVKNREDADSENARQLCWDWYTSTAYTRLAPGGGVLVIQTRWHDDDLSGRLLEAQDHGGDEWEIVLYEAIASNDEEFRHRGEPLHEERYDLPALQRIRKAVGERDWHALYQQTPVADTGNYFQDGMMPTYDQMPDLDNLNVYQAWDFAVGVKEENDYTVGITVGMDKDARLYVLDVCRGKWDGFGIVNQILDSYERWKPLIVGMEKGQIQMSLKTFLDREVMRRECFGFNAEPLSPGKNDKMARARGIQGLMQQQQVLFPRPGTTSWVDSLTYELKRFPTGVHDDCVDALAYIGYIYGMMTTVPEKIERDKGKSWRDRLAEFISDTDADRKRWQRS